MHCYAATQLCLAVLAAWWCSVLAEDVARLRHVGRFAKLNDIWQKLDRLDDHVSLGNQSSTIEDAIAATFGDDDDFEGDSDLIDYVDEENRNQDKAADDWWSGFNDDPWQDDYDQEWDTSPQGDADQIDTTTEKSKWTYFGTREDLKNSRNPTRKRQSDTFKAVQHVIYIKREGSCKTPKKKVINIQNVYPNVSKSYIPHCTILHVCSDDTGCCSSDLYTCSPKFKEEVELYFYTKIVGILENQVEKFTFINHTECHCTLRMSNVLQESSVMIDDEDSSKMILPELTLRSSRSFQKLNTPHSAETEAPIPLKRCQCPSEFSVHVMIDGDCICDCLNKQKDCMRIKRGKEYFGLKDRICIQEGQCNTPMCEFGDYIHKAGRCPKRYEKSDESHRHSRNI